MSIDPFKTLPKYVSLNILSYLESKELTQCAKVSKKWNELAEHGSLPIWKNLLDFCSKTLNMNVNSVKELKEIFCQIKSTSQQDLLVHNTLLEKYPNFFPQIEISRQKMKRCGDELRSMLTNNNVQNLTLFKSCVQKIYKTLDLENVLPMLAFAAQNNFPEVEWVCIVFLHDEAAPKLLEAESEKILKLNPEPNQTTKRILNLLEMTKTWIELNCNYLDSGFQITPVLSKDLHRTVIIDESFTGGINEKLMLNALSQINDVIGITGLKFPPLKQPLDKIAEVCPNIKELVDYCSGIKSIPIQWKDSMQILGFKGCNDLTCINTLSAIDITCESCVSVTSIYAPDALYIACTACKSVTSIYAPNALYINCNFCESLTSLYAPKAKVIKCNGCKALPGLDAPNAIKAFALDCDALKFIKAPQALQVTCFSSQSLTSIHVPNVIEILCSSCPLLESLNVPLATKVDCSHCTSLTFLHAQNVIDLHCSFCPALGFLDVPMAIEIQCTGSENLTLNAPNAKISKRFPKN